ncbi:MAG TPA: HAD family phosphatase, partial [Acidimicrobiales bacterium]|nr:HAD family phosphatase [Acidimicrobiales bacterium]
MAVAAVVFDMGGVLTEPPFLGLEQYAGRLGLPPDALAKFFRGDPTMARFETGTISSREFFKYVCVSCQDLYGVRVDIHELARAAEMGERLQPETLELVAEVHRRVKTALLTNNVKTAGWRQGFPFEEFDVVVDSSQVGIRKPDPAIYRYLIDALALDPEAIAFFDDFEENVEAALRLGIQAFV